MRAGFAAVKTILACALLLGIPAGWAANSAAPPAASLYSLHERLVDQEGTATGLDVHRGKKVLVTMFYSSCPASCPLIIDTLRAVERKLDASQRAGVRILMISLDPERDSPRALRELAASRHIDTRRWTLAQADDASVRRIAAALEIQYRRLPDGQISHASVITALGEDGEILARSSELGRADETLLRALGSHGDSP
jgi:protein SCO1/2